jgi:hypothetical protein
VNAQVINKIEELIQTLNQKQQIIANRTKINKNFRFFESFVGDYSEIYFEDLMTKQIYHFKTYIKSNCGCD